VLDTWVTCRPEGSLSLTAGVALGFPPTGATKTWNDGPDAGAGVHWKAQPMFHGGAVIVNVGLVQFPCNWVAGTRIWIGPVDGATVVDVEAAAVVVVLGAVVVVVAEPRPLAEAPDEPERAVERERAAELLVLPGGSVVDGVVVVGAAPPDAAGGGRV